MTSTTSSEESPQQGLGTEFPKPGPGSWALDTGHFSADSSRICQDLITSGCTNGTTDGFELIGAPLKCVEAAFVRGRFYTRIAPLVGSDKDLPTPPAPVLWLATRVAPPFRKAEKIAKAAIADRAWMAEHQRWIDEWRPQLIADWTRLSAVDPAARTDTELADHLLELNRLTTKSAALHFRLHISDLGPVGLLLVRSREWGLKTGEVMMTLAGHSPATNAPGEALADLRALVADSDATPTSLEEVRSISPQASSMLDGFLDEFGWRLTTGYDLRALSLREMPDAILASINAPIDHSATQSNENAKAAGDEALAALCAKIPANEVAELKQLVADARALYGLRDENGPLTYQWPAGLIRRAVLEISDRLDAAGRLPADPNREAGSPNDVVFDLSAAEMSALLQGGASPGVTDLEQRAALRRHNMTLTAPENLGRVEDNPPLWTMPPNLSQLMDIVLTVMDLLEVDDHTVGELQGHGIGTDTVTGRACVVTDADDAALRIEPGDILVAPYTVPTYNAVLSLAGAIVTDGGGLLCHAAVIAREYGIAGVVGVGAATSQIQDGATIEVDPTTGRIRILELA